VSNDSKILIDKLNLEVAVAYFMVLYQRFPGDISKSQKIFR